MSYPAYHALDEVPVRLQTGVGGFGPIYAAPVTVRCRREDSSKLLRDVNGDLVESTTSLDVPASEALPDGLALAGAVVEIVGERTTHVVSWANIKRRGQLVYTKINLA